MGRHNDIARPVESEDLAISVLEKADCPHDPLNDLDLLRVFLTFPKRARQRGTKDVDGRRKLGTLVDLMTLRRRIYPSEVNADSVSI